MNGQTLSLECGLVIVGAMAMFLSHPASATAPQETIKTCDTVKAISMPLTSMQGGGPSEERKKGEPEIAVFPILRSSTLVSPISSIGRAVEIVILGPVRIGWADDGLEIACTPTGILLKGELEMEMSGQTVPPVSLRTELELIPLQSDIVVQASWGIDPRSGRSLSARATIHAGAVAPP